MLELTINETVYSFNFGMGFMREINALVGKPVDGVPNKTQNIGLRFYVLGLLDYDLEMLVDVLMAANKGMNPRATRALIESHIDSPDTDIDALFKEVLDFLSGANATKKAVAAVMEAVEAEKAKANKK